MNKHLRAFLIKLVGSFAILFLILGLGYGMTFTQVLTLSIVLGAVAYLVGDLFVLPRTNNAIGTIADFILSWAVIYYFVNTMAPTDNVFTATLLATVGVSIFEIFFHRYIAKNVLPDEDPRTEARNLRYQTEIAEELDMEEIRNRNHQNK